jgi:hypothetical protein
MYFDERTKNLFINKLKDQLPLFVASHVDCVDVCGVIVGDKVVCHRIVKVMKPLRARVLEGRHELAVAARIRLIRNQNVCCKIETQYSLIKRSKFGCIRRRKLLTKYFRRSKFVFIRISKVFRLFLSLLRL